MRWLDGITDSMGVSLSGEGNGNPLQYSCLENPRDREAWCTPVFLGFPGGSAGKESACHAGRSGFDPWVGRSAGEGNWLHLGNAGGACAHLGKDPDAGKD